MRTPAAVENPEKQERSRQTSARDPEVWRFLWYYPLRDLLGFLFWLASFTGRTITWRGELYRLGPSGRVVSLRHGPPAEPASHAAPVRPTGTH